VRDGPWGGIFALFFAGCARDVQREASTGGGAPIDVSTAETSSGSSSAGGAQTWCELPWTLFTGLSVPVTSPDGSCLDSDLPAILDVCLTDAEASPAFQCFARIGSAQQAWVWDSSEVLALDPAEWTSCADDARIPPPCFPGTCDTAGLESTCSEAATRGSFGCGAPTTQWDDDCCWRPSCADEPCPRGFECREISTIAYMYCWAAENPDDCSCGGTSGGPVLPLCFPE